MSDAAPTVCLYEKRADTSEKHLYRLAYYYLTCYFGLILAYMALLAGLIGPAVSAENLAPVKEVLNYLTPITTMVAGFFFGGAFSGRHKDDALAAANVAVAAAAAK